MKVFTKKFRKYMKKKAEVIHVLRLRLEYIKCDVAVIRYLTGDGEEHLIRLSPGNVLNVTVPVDFNIYTHMRFRDEWDKDNGKQ